MRNHPSDVELAAIAIGTLSEGQYARIVGHVGTCAHCRAFVRAMEYVGGVWLDGLPPTPLAGRSPIFEVLARPGEGPDDREILARRENPLTSLAR
jgi:anti-sigma factor ChrR (cupin superfamily)